MAVDNDKLLEDYGQAVILDFNGKYSIKHAIPVGKRNVIFIQIFKTYTNEEEHRYAIYSAREEYQKLKNKYIKNEKKE